LIYNEYIFLYYWSFFSFSGANLEGFTVGLVGLSLIVALLLLALPPSSSTFSKEDIIFKSDSVNNVVRCLLLKSKCLNDVLICNSAALELVLSLVFGLVLIDIVSGFRVVCCCVEVVD